ncbi:hypothetical protein [Vampirovibrio sp.]|uniref:hypothetical protein n=1 Tax=Vampirovibrio sp. TaxID=2717857 RepID=UPI0035946798
MPPKLPTLLLLLTLVGFTTGCMKQRMESDSMTKPPGRSADGARPEQPAEPPIELREKAVKAPPVSATPLNADPRWFACQKESDCIVVKGPCGEPQALNAGFQSPFANYRQRLEKAIECLGEAKMPLRQPVYCIKHRCALKPD